ncbi:hypothetical protein WG219_04785 [Ectopseudomonas mendocina]|uniref:Uncharacterized protein n=1 Tax=Ectopseudomonas mendocina TaxID=300 RepID=A0ABZ2RL52_ECTME
MPKRLRFFLYLMMAMGFISGTQALNVYATEFVRPIGIGHQKPSNQITLLQNNGSLDPAFTQLDISLSWYGFLKWTVAAVTGGGHPCAQGY